MQEKATRNIRRGKEGLTFQMQWLFIIKTPKYQWKSDYKKIEDFSK